MEDFEKQLLKVYVSPMSKILGIIFLLLGVIGNSILFIILSNSSMDLNEFSWDVAFAAPEGDSPGWIPFLIPWFMCMVFILIGIILIVSNRLKVAKIQSLIKNGEKVEAKVVSNIQNFYVQQNRVPRREVTFKTDAGKHYVFKFFSEQLASIFPENSVFNIITSKSELAIPDPDFIKKMIDSDTNQSYNETMENKNFEAFQKWVEGAEKFENNGDMESAASFYETALKTKKDEAIAKRLIDIYYKNKDYEKESTLREEMKNW